MDACSRDEGIDRRPENSNKENQITDRRERKS